MIEDCHIGDSPLLFRCLFPVTLKMPYWAMLPIYSAWALMSGKREPG